MTTPTRVLLCDRATGRPAREVRLDGLRYELALSGAGSLTGTLSLDDPAVDRTTPGAVFAAVLRGNSVVWAGPVIDATASLAARTVTITAATDDWWLAGRVIRQDLLVTADVFRIVRDLVRVATGAQPIPGLKVSGNSHGTSKTVQVLAEDLLDVGRLVQDLAQADDGTGFEFRWEFGWDLAAGIVTRTLVLGAPRVGARREHRAVMPGAWLVDATLPRAAEPNAVLAVGSPPEEPVLPGETMQQATTRVRTETGDPRALPGQSPRAYRVDTAAADAHGLVEQVVNLADTPAGRLGPSAVQHVARTATAPVAAAWQVVWRPTGPAGAMPWDLALPGDEVAQRLDAPVFTSAGLWHRVERHTTTVDADGDEQVTVALQPVRTGPGGAARRYGTGTAISQAITDGRRTLAAVTKLGNRLTPLALAAGQTSVQAGRAQVTTTAEGLATVTFPEAFPAGSQVIVTATPHRQGTVGEPYTIELATVTETGFTADVLTAAGPVAGIQVVFSWHATGTGAGTPGGTLPPSVAPPEPAAPAEPTDPNDPDSPPQPGGPGAAYAYDDSFTGPDRADVGLPYRIPHPSGGVWDPAVQPVEAGAVIVQASTIGQVGMLWQPTASGRAAVLCEHQPGYPGDDPTRDVGVPFRIRLHARGVDLTAATDNPQSIAGLDVSARGRNTYANDQGSAVPGGGYFYPTTGSGDQPTVLYARWEPSATVTGHTDIRFGFQTADGLAGWEQDLPFTVSWQPGGMSAVTVNDGRGYDSYRAARWQVDPYTAPPFDPQP